MCDTISNPNSVCHIVCLGLCLGGHSYRDMCVCALCRLEPVFEQKTTYATPSQNSYALNHKIATHALNHKIATNTYAAACCERVCACMSQDSSQKYDCHCDIL